MTRTLSAAGALALATLLYALVQFTDGRPQRIAAFPAGAGTADSTKAARDAPSDPIEELATWPAAAGR
jgi:hypothetical protein